MTVLMIVSYVFAGLVLLIFLRIFWRPIVFVAVLAWELFWKGLIPLLTLPFLAASAARHQRRNAATMKAPAAGSAGEQTEREWMAHAVAKVDAALADETTRST